MSETISRRLRDLFPCRANDICKFMYPVAVLNGSRKLNQENPLTITYAGRLQQRQKRILDLIALSDLLALKNGSYHFKIAGDGQEAIPTALPPLSKVSISTIPAPRLTAQVIRTQCRASSIRSAASANGLAFSPDEKILYANGSRERFVRAYDVQPNDTLTNSRLLIDLNNDPRPGITDGMKVDVKGNIWESGPGGIWIISPQGKAFGHIQVPELVANVAFGDADYKTLYIVARTSVYKIRVDVRGIP